MHGTLIEPGFVRPVTVQHFPASLFPWIHPVHWLNSHFAVGGWSPLQRLSGMLTAHMTRIAPRSGFFFNDNGWLEIYTWVIEGTLHHEDSTGGQGDIGPGELQRMFSGDLIQHQELNHTDEPVRVIQIWFLANPQSYGVAPHYQQLGKRQLPARRAGGATVYDLVGGSSPMQQHMTGRLTATEVEPDAGTTLELPQPGDDLLVYVTDGAGSATHDGTRLALGQYDVMLARADAGRVMVESDSGQSLHFLSFSLCQFMPGPG